MTRRVLRDSQTLTAEYEKLLPGDVVVGRLRLRPGEEHILLDLTARGVTLIPPALSQLCSRSKVFQARLLGSYMLPGTAAVYNRHDLQELIIEYGRREVGRVVCKLDRGNGGQGVLLFASVEEVYSASMLGSLSFPYVLQPFVENCRDLRAVFLGTVEDAYERFNPHGFRHNLHCGAESRPAKLSEGQRALCRKVMERAGFPYAHIDLLVDGTGATWLGEINLRGGLRGSRLNQKDYLEAVESMHERMLAELVNTPGK
ncbi:MAG: hypothetical protein Kow0089_09840 [Desulfobulbaceae bacterium]